jgi:hypothetical protein
MTIACQQLGKHSPGVTLLKVGHPLLGNGPLNMHSRTREDGVFRGVRAEEL